MISGSTRVSVQAACGIGVGVAAILLAVAGLLALTGRSLEGLKLALFVLLLPGLVLMTVWLVRVVRHPGWYRSVRLWTAFLFEAGAVLFLVPLLIWLPLSPISWAVEDLPQLLRLPLVSGLAFVAAGWLLALLEAAAADWRTRDYGRVATDIVLLALTALIASAAIARQVI